MNKEFNLIKKQILSCTICESHLPHGVNPVVQINPKAKILIAGQAPGRKVHESNIPFNDASGKRLRDWMGVSDELFYDPEVVAIVPMGFCFPGTGKSGDLPPRPECAKKWRSPLLEQLPNIELTILIGLYAMKWHLKKEMASTLTETVKNWKNYPDNIFPIPHPSPRNFGWLRKNPWFEDDVLPHLKQRISKLLAE
jgi:uracil-DNA glycosylase